MLAALAGYIYRKLIKGMEDCKVHFDLTTRNAAGSIIQFLAGEDGIDSTKLESNHLWYMALTPEEIKQEVWVDTRFDAHLAGILDDREFMAVRMFRGELERSVLSPVNFDRVLARVAECASDDGDALDAGEALGHLEAFLATLALHRPGEPDQPNSLMRMLARAHLSPKRVLRRYHTALQAVRRVYQQAVVHPGEMIGIIAAQSLGEPSTCAAARTSAAFFLLTAPAAAAPAAAAAAATAATTITTTAPCLMPLLLCVIVNCCCPYTAHDPDRAGS
jgi:DNA-directed RNA polymerase II subunit RPB1